MIVSRTLRRAVAASAATVLAGTFAVGIAPNGAAAQEEFINGSGKAGAKILRIGPSAGRLSLAPTIGVTLADFLGTLGRGESRTADFAALDGTLPPEVVSNLPTVRAESTDDNAGTPQTASFAGTPSSSPVKVGGSDQSATAFKDPKGTSTYTLGAYGIPGVFEMGSSTAQSTAAVIGGKTREAVGTTKVSTIKIGPGGLVTLNGLTWEAVQRTGEGAVTSADFRVDSVTILQQGGLLGLPLPPLTLPVPGGGTNFDAVLGPINTALKPSGLIVTTPTRSTEGGVARVGPLAIQVADSEVGRTLLGPVLGAAQPVRDPLTGALLNASSEFSTAVLLADVAVGVFSGAGRNDIEFGGASAFTEGEVFENPFGAFNFGSFELPDSSDSAFSLGDSSSDSSFLSSSSPSAGAAGFSPTSGSSLSAGATTARTGPTAAAPAGAQSTRSAQTAVPAAAARTIAGKRGGAAALIGLLGLLMALAMASMDYRHIRSNRRNIVVS